MSRLLRYGLHIALMCSLVCLIWSVSVHGFNNSVCSEFGTCVFVKVLFRSKGFSVTQITGSSFNCVLPAPQRRCQSFIYKDFLTTFFLESGGKSFYLKNYIFPILYHDWV